MSATGRQEIEKELYQSLTDFATELATISDLDRLCSFVAERGASLVGADAGAVFLETRPLPSRSAPFTLSVPLRHNEDDIGVLVVERHKSATGKHPRSKPAAFKPEDERCLTLLANIAAVAAANIKRAETVQRRVRWRERALDILQEMGHAMGSTLELVPLMRRIVQTAVNALNAEFGLLALADSDDQIVVRATTGALSNDLVGTALAADGSLVGWVMREKGPALVNDPDADSRTLQTALLRRMGVQPKRLLAAPLVTKGQVIGAIKVGNRRDGAFDQEDLHLLEALAVPAASAIENTRVYERLQRVALQQENIIRVGHALISADDTQAILQKVVESAIWTIPSAVTAAVHLLDRTTETLELHCYAGQRTWEKMNDPFVVGQGIAGHVFASRKLINVGDVVREVRFVPGPGRVVYRSMLVAPLIVEEKPLGTLSVNGLDPHAFGSEDEQMLHALATQAAVVLHSAGLLESLRESEARYRRLVENANALLITADQRGQIIFAGGRWVEMLGYRPNEVVGLSYQHLCHPEDWSTLAKHTNRLVKEPSKATDVRYRTWHKDGTIRWHQVSAVSTAGPDGQVERIHAVIHDVTEQVEAEHAIARHADHLAALNTIASYISRSLDINEIVQVGLQKLLDALELDLAGLILLDADPNSLIPQTVLGLRSEFIPVVEMLARSEPALLDGSSPPVVIADLATDARLEHFPRLRETVDRERVRTLVIVAVTAQEIKAGVLFVGSRTATDVSASALELLVTIGQQLGVALQNARLYAQVEERAAELEAANVQLQQLAQRKNQFVQNTSHELRTPLTFIRGYLEMLHNGEFGRLSQAQQEVVDTALEKCETLVSLVNDISSLIDIELRPKDIESVDLVDVVARSANALKYRIQEADVVLESDWPDKATMVRGDYHRLMQAFTHLLDNAIKFSSSGGCIQVRIRREEQAAVVEVTDQGIGIPPEEQAMIFDRFYQIDGSTTRKYGGTGLGLAIVKETIDAHGGTIQVSSSGVEGEGATMRVTLPLMTRDEQKMRRRR